MPTSALITVMTAAVRKAARGVVRDFGEIEKLQVSKKGAANFVTSADLRTEKLLVEELQHARPKFSFLTEETGQIGNPTAKNRFVIDPIDGTTNFIHAIPYIAITVAAQERDANGQWQTTAGIIYDPVHDELFWAEKGRGAYLDRLRLRVSQREEDIVLSTSSPRKWREGYKETLHAFERVIDHGATVRCSGSAALDLAYVAAGRLDGMWYSRLNCWDMLAGSLLVSEAQGLISATDGSPVITDDRGSVLASNGRIHATLLELLAPGTK
jgi:myo-inositol-1(or 4)-monophosphatase